MRKKIKFLTSLIICLNLFNVAFSSENFFETAKKQFKSKNFQESKFLFQRNIVFNPKDAKSYLYLAKIYHHEENDVEKLKNVNTTLLLEPKNEEAIYMLMEIELKKSNYSKVKELTEIFSTVCVNLCEKKIIILDTLKNLEPKNES